MSGRAAIIGGGVIGGGWAARFLLNGWDVRVFDPDPEAERKIGAVLDNARRALPMLYDCALPPEGKLSFHGRLAEATQGAAWIQESVPEQLAMKQRLYADLQAVCDPAAIIGSSTSGFKPSELQEGAARPDQIIVCHPFNPVYLIPLIEVVGSDRTPPERLETAQDILRGLGHFPMQVRREIDAHIGDRFLEAVWREALWMIKDGIATTEEIDNVIRYGFGLRWAQMGLFETYRIAGGEAGMRHFIAQFGPALKWPWTKLMDVPELTDELTGKIADQSDAQSGHMSIRELERLRDDNLVAMMRALKGQDAAAGALIRKHEKTLYSLPGDADPLITQERVVPVDWTDMNGHMNEGRYGQIFSDAAEVVMAMVGVDADYVARGMSYFSVETTIRYLAECHAGDRVEVHSRITEGAGKKLRCAHELRRGEEVLAACDQLMLHVSLETRRSCAPPGAVRDKLAALAQRHGE